jgi:hypothetical protein
MFYIRQKLLKEIGVDEPVTSFSKGTPRFNNALIYDYSPSLMKVTQFTPSGKTGFMKWVFYMDSSSAFLVEKTHGVPAQTSVKCAKAEI